MKYNGELLHLHQLIVSSAYYWDDFEQLISCLYMIDHAMLVGEMVRNFLMKKKKAS